MAEAYYWLLSEQYEKRLDDIRERDREIEVLTTERNNALLRIEELESDCRDFQQEIGEWSQLAGNQQSEIEELEQQMSEVAPDYWEIRGNRGGVNPNA